jgi:hypothetical protein
MLKGRKATDVALLSAVLAISVSLLWAGQPLTATPFVSPASGIYTSGRTVTISDATSGAAVYYTTDGSVPTTASTLYIGPISVPSSPVTETVRAFAVLNAVHSSTTSATYTIAPRLPVPNFSPVQGSYMRAQTITISTSNLNGAIHYTTDGTAPTLNSLVYRAPISVTNKVTIKAIVAGVAGYSASGLVAATYSIIPATPFISPASGTYTSGRAVTISDATSGTAIYYTTDGSMPTTASTVYLGPISMPSSTATETVRAFAVASGVYSSATSATYTINQPLPVSPRPVIFPLSGIYTTGRVITISDSLVGATIFYTIDGTTPTQNSTRYVIPFNTRSTTGTEVVKAIAISGGYLPSAIAQSNITLSLPAGVIASSLVASTPGAEIPTNFLGFSHEWGSAQRMMGTASSGTNQIYQTLVRTLSTNMNGPIVLRIGGGSTDLTGSASPATLEPLVELAQQLNVAFILGINLGSNNLRLAEEQATMFTSSLPARVLMALEIGNEPDGYSSNGLRSPNYSYADFRLQYQQWAQGVSAYSASPIPIAGPVFGGDRWIVNAQPDVAASVLRAGVITQHKYVSCYYVDNPLPSDILLRPSSSTGSLFYLQPYAAAAHKVKSIFRMDEINSICNGGQPGVSDSFSSALWAIDTMFEDANAGIDGVNWNTDSNGGPYDLFKFSVWAKAQTNIYSLTTVHPLYYGLLFFSQAAGKSAHLLPTSTLTTSNIKVWVTTDSAGKAHLVVINKEETTAGNVQVTLPGYLVGSVVRLTAGSYLATSGVSIGGQTYDNSPDGTLQGSPSIETAYPDAGVWTIFVDPMSAVMVNLQP